MHNRALHDTLAAFVREAARQLADEVAGGAELPFELVESGGAAAAPLYCWRPLTGRFVAERTTLLARLESYPAAAQGLAALPNLAGYLRTRGRRVPGDAPRAQADATLQALLTVVWEDAGEFHFEPERFEAAYAELERVGYEGMTLAVVVTPVDGLVIESEVVALGDNLALARGTSLLDAPADLRGDAYATVAVLRLEGAATGEGAEAAGLAAAGRRLRRLQTALRLWDDAEPVLGPTAWARTAGGPWLGVPLTSGLRRPEADCLLPAEDEDPLRAFCALVARRTPRGGELAWALRRFELGCERASALEALTDWLLAARALLGPERAFARLAAICAPLADREALAARLEEAAALERGVVAGVVRAQPEVEALVEHLGGHLRAVLRDVLCGHLDPALRGVADDLIAAAAPILAGQAARG